MKDKIKTAGTSETLNSAGNTPMHTSPVSYLQTANILKIFGPSPLSPYKTYTVFQLRTMKAYWGRIMALLIHNLGTSSLVVNATARPLYPRERTPVRRLRGSQRRFGSFGEKVSWRCWNSNPRPTTSPRLLHFLLLPPPLLRWHYSSMRTSTSLIDLSQSALFIDLFPVFNFPFINICLCTDPPSVFGRPPPLSQYNIYGTRVAEVIHLTKL